MAVNQDQGSGLRLYSLGIVIEDSTEDSDYIKVTPIEELPLAYGDLSEAKYNYKTKGTDHKGVLVSTNTKGVDYLVAKWILFGGGNRTTAPSIKKGETVLLFKFASANDVYWCEIFREPGLRRLENAVYSYSNLKIPGEAYDQESSYWFQVSTRDKVIRLVTCNNDDEPVAYNFHLNTAEGTFTVEDSNNNKIFLDSVHGDLKLDIMNSIEMNAPMIRINGKDYVRTTGAEITNSADSSIKLNSGGTWDAQSGGTINLHNPTEVTGTVNATGVITGAGISLSTHVHLYNPGPNSPTPSGVAQ